MCVFSSPVLHSKVHILRRFSKKLRECASSRPQLIEALIPVVPGVRLHDWKEAATRSLPHPQLCHHGCVLALGSLGP